MELPFNEIKKSKKSGKNSKNVNENLVSLIAKIGEKITIGKAKTIENAGTVNNHYLHTVAKANISKLASAPSYAYPRCSRSLIVSIRSSIFGFFSSISRPIALNIAITLDLPA